MWIKNANHSTIVFGHNLFLMEAHFYIIILRFQSSHFSESVCKNCSASFCSSLLLIVWKTIFVMLMWANCCSKLSHRCNRITSLAICCTIVIDHAGSSSSQMLSFFNTGTVSLTTSILAALILKMEAVHSSETLVWFNQIAELNVQKSSS